MRIVTITIALDNSAIEHDNKTEAKQLHQLLNEFPSCWIRREAAVRDLLEDMGISLKSGLEYDVSCTLS